MWHPLPNTLKYYIHCTFIIDNLEDADKAKKKSFNSTANILTNFYHVCTLFTNLGYFHTLG